MDERLRGLIRYSEYIAHTVDLSVSYSENLGRIMAKARHTPTIGKVDIISVEHTPTFKEFTKEQRAIRKFHLGAQDLQKFLCTFGYVLRGRVDSHTP
jgi:hypothetical protein